jgi:hypothetical protein
MSWLLHQSDTADPQSLSNRMRNKRFRLFERLTESMPRPLRIIDIGGTVDFWEQRKWVDRDDVQITLVNLEAQPQRYSNVTPTIGNATNLSDVANHSFDVAFSNSVIEHLFTFENQFSMAQEMQRVAAAYWLQTPNYWFPFEPHFQLPAWQWMPVWLRIEILRRRGAGRSGPIRDPALARQFVLEVRLMTQSELAQIFPGATIVPEKFAALTKSWILYGGFPALRPDAD